MQAHPLEVSHGLNCAQEPDGEFSIDEEEELPGDLGDAKDPDGGIGDMRYTCAIS